MVGCILELDEEILARIRAAKVWDKDSKLEDFQIQTHGNGLVLSQFNIYGNPAPILLADAGRLANGSSQGLA